MTSQKLQQQVVSDYLQQHTIIHTLEKALNQAIEFQVSSPEVFIADYLMKQRKQKALIQLQQIQLAGDNLIIIIDFLGLLRHFKYPNFDQKTSNFTEQIYPELTNIDLLQPFPALWELLNHSAPLYTMLHKSVQSLLRESEPESLSRILNREKQLFTLQKLMVPIFEIPGKVKIGLIMRKDPYSFANFIVKSLELKGKFPFQISQNDKNFELQCEFSKLKLTAEDAKIPNFQELLTELKNEKVVVEQVEEVKKDAGKKGSTGVFSSKLSNSELVVAVFTAFARLCEESQFQEFSKIFVQINANQVKELSFSEVTRQFENFLLTLFVQGKNDFILILNELNTLPEEASVQAQIVQAGKRAPSANKKGKEVAKEPVEAVATNYLYNFENAEIDILQATQHFYHLQNYEKSTTAITVFSDFPVKKAIICKEVCCNPVVNAVDLQQYYEGLAVWAGKEKAEEDEQYHKFFVSGQRPITPVDNKAKAKGKEVVEVKKSFISKTMCGILENVDYQLINQDSEINEYMQEIQGLMLEKRACYQ